MSRTFSWLSCLAVVATAALPITGHADRSPRGQPAPSQASALGGDTTADTLSAGTVPQLTVQQWLNQPKDAPPVRLGDGHVYLLDFTEYWCHGCPYTYGPLADIARHYAARGVRVVLVTSLAQHDLAFIQHYFAEHQVTLPIAIGHGNSRQFGISSLPNVLLIDGQGSIRHRWTGGSTDSAGYEQEVAATLDSVLAAPPRKRAAGPAVLAHPRGVALAPAKALGRRSDGQDIIE